MKRNLIYHAGCPDGFGAAWAAWRRWGDDARYIPRGHEDRFDARRFDGDLVVFADISLPNDALLELSEVAEEIIVLDHAYHGHSPSLVEISPYKSEGPGGEGLAEHAHKVPMPDPYRGPHRGADAGDRYATTCRRQSPRSMPRAARPAPSWPSR